MECSVMYDDGILAAVSYSLSVNLAVGENEQTHSRSLEGVTLRKQRRNLSTVVT